MRRQKNAKREARIRLSRKAKPGVRVPPPAGHIRICYAGFRAKVIG